MIELNLTQVLVGLAVIFGAPLTGLIAVLRYHNRQVSTGQLIPKSTHDLIVADKEARIDEWRDTTGEVRKTLKVTQDALVISQQQTNEAQQANEVTKMFMAEIRPIRPVPPVQGQVTV